MRKFTLVTGHGKLEFVVKENGNLELVSVNDKALLKAKIGKLGKDKEAKQ